MQKDFDNWNKKKKEINIDRKNIFYKERDIRWCSLGINIGFEQDGKKDEFRRPVLVLKKFSKQTCLILPLTTSEKSNMYYFSIGDITGKSSSVILSQIRLIDTKRLSEKICVLNKEVFENIQEKIREFF